MNSVFNIGNSDQNYMCSPPKWQPEMFTPFSHIGDSARGYPCASPQWEPEMFTPFSHVDACPTCPYPLPESELDMPIRKETKVETFGPMSGWQTNTPPWLVAYHERLHAPNKKHCACGMRQPQQSTNENFEMLDGYVPNEYMHHEIYQQPINKICSVSEEEEMEALYQGLQSRDVSSEQMPGQMMIMMEVPEKKKGKSHIVLLVLCILVLFVLMTAK